MYKDRTLVCNDCKENFTFTTGEQEFYAEKGFTNDPVRCPECRNARKKSRGDNRRGGGHGGGHASGQQRRELFNAICAECGVETQVPFKPSNNRPVYCRDCFTQR